MFARRSARPHRTSAGDNTALHAEEHHQEPSLSPSRSPRSVFALVLPHRTTPRGNRHTHAKDAASHLPRDDGGKPRVVENASPKVMLFPLFDLTEQSSEGPVTPSLILRSKSYETEAASTQPTSTSHDEPLSSSLPNESPSAVNEAPAAADNEAARLLLLPPPPPPPESVSLLRSSSQSVCSELSEDDGAAAAAAAGRDLPSPVAPSPEQEEPKGDEEGAVPTQPLYERESSEVLQPGAGDDGDSGGSVPLNPPVLLPFVPPEYVIITHDNCFPLEL